MLANLWQQVWIRGAVWFLASGLVVVGAQIAGGEIRHTLTPKVALGIRIHNPLDIRPVPLPDRWDGQIDVHTTSDGDFAVFEEYAYALRAGADLLLAYSRHHDIHALVGPGGLDAQDGIVTRWAPASDGNDPATYSTRMARLTGFAVDQYLDLEDPATVATLLRAMTRVEMGLNDTEPLPYSDEEMQRALQLSAFINPVTVN